MPDDLTFLDQLEEWLENQVPTNLHELPHRVFETMERVSNEIFETLNIHGAPSISIPFPPFGKEIAAPPPPPPPSRFHCGPGIYHKTGKLIKAHPYAVGATAALALTVGLGLGGAVWKYGLANRYKRRNVGVKGLVEDGMLKEAIVILSPSPVPAVLSPLTVSLLRAGYVVLVAVPKVEDAESLEKRLAGLEERSALRVLIYDPEDSSTFPAFHRSLQATLTLRFAAQNNGRSDPYNPKPEHIPHIHAFVSLYPMNPSPPSQPSPLPALPTLFQEDKTGKRHKLITLYPSSATLVNPDDFASQIATTNHQLLGKNVGVMYNVKVVSMFIGNVDLPVLDTMKLSGGSQLSRRQQAKEQLRSASTQQKVGILKNYVGGIFSTIWKHLAAQFGIGNYSRDYAVFERDFLRAIKGRYRREYHLGQFSILSAVLGRLPLPILPLTLQYLPVTLPSATGPSYHPNTISSTSTSKRGRRGDSDRANSRTNSSASSSDHESVEDLSSSMHTDGTTSSRGASNVAGTTQSGRASASNGSGYAMEESWVGIDERSL